ncbi:White collar 2 protein [Choanephora cucurbitarum]|uniref:White collar 2 protein n=1 Tax=Choanephora cucurbitarum TaxID=101091 RepID=A0A1C7N7F4_9FUNG|nr:White collar 2 protein [Choanephora cucurbitarum]
MIPWSQSILASNPKHYESHNADKGSECPVNNSTMEVHPNNSLSSENSELASDRSLWSERALQNITGLFHILSPSGTILYCSDSCMELTGYCPRELIGRMLIDFVHVDDLDIFTRRVQFAFHSMSKTTTHFRFRCKGNNTYILLESVGQWKQDVLEQFPRSFFAIAQPYFSQPTNLLDSFLELKMENEWLKKRLNEASMFLESYSKRPSKACLIQSKSPTSLPYNPQLATQEQEQEQKQTNLSFVASMPFQEESSRGSNGEGLSYWNEYQYRISTKTYDATTKPRHQQEESSTSLMSTMPSNAFIKSFDFTAKRKQKNFDVLISPSDLASVYYEFKRVTLPPSISQLNFAKPASATVAYSFINDADIPTYAAIYSCKTKQSSLSSTSLNSDISTESDSSISTPSDEQDVKRYYSESSKSPPKAHCRSRKATHVNILLYENSES